MSNRRTPLEPEIMFHFYNHANGQENLFVNEGNYKHFLKKYDEYLSPVFDTFAYCLLPNHYHFLIRVKDNEKLWKVYDPKGIKKPVGSELSHWLSHQVGNWQNSYTKAFNKQQRRMGSLFIPTFCRKQVDKPDYFLQVLHYIHLNPIHHNLVRDITDWPFTSYHTYLSRKESKLNREETISWCGGFQAFLDLHRKPIGENFGLGMEDFS